MLRELPTCASIGIGIHVLCQYYLSVRTSTSSYGDATALGSEACAGPRSHVRTPWGLSPDRQETENKKNIVSVQGGGRAFVSRSWPSGVTRTPVSHTSSHQIFFLPEAFHNRRSSQEIRRAKAMAAPAITSWTLVGPKSRKYYLVGPHLQKRISGIVFSYCLRFVCLSM